MEPDRADARSASHRAARRPDVDDHALENGRHVFRLTGDTCSPTSRRTLLLTSLCGVLAVLAAVLAPGAHAAAKRPTRSWKSGAMVGYGGDGDAAFGTWRGSAVQTGTDYLPEDTWANLQDPAWDIWAWGLSPAITPVLSAPLFPQSGGSLAESASGADNAHWVTLAQNLVAGGLGSSVIRLGWEFNGTWYAWSVTTPAQAAQYAAAWRQIVTAMRSVPGAHFSFDWCTTTATGGINPALAYPGNSYVDYIGQDVYDWNERALNESATQRWNDLVNNGYGMAWQAAFAASNHKPVSFPEWAEASNTSAPGTGGGDDPTFIQNMYNWFGAHNTAYEDYFDSDTGYGTDYGLTTGNGLFPKSAALYESLYTAATYQP
jgi:Glycosyl hydrolase family 26